MGGFKRAFCKGFHLLKFGRSGKPKKRDVWLSAHHERVNVNHPSHHADKGVLVHDIIKVTKGCATPNFAHNHYYVLKHKIDEDCCFSMVTHDRSWDLKCETEQQRDEIVRGIQLLRRADYHKDDAKVTKGYSKGGFVRDETNTVGISTVGAGAHLPESDSSSDEDDNNPGPRGDKAGALGLLGAKAAHMADTQ
jgi:hypothetical protein